MTGLFGILANSWVLNSKKVSGVVHEGFDSVAGHSELIGIP